MKKSKEKTNFILIATIGKSKGLNGEFFLNSLSEPKENIINYINFKFGDSKKSIKFDYIKPINKKLIAKLIDINDVDEIKKLTNKELFINKSQLPELPDDEVYWHDLIGMKVINTLNEDIGIVDEVNNFGSSDILMINPSKTSIDNESRLIPFIKDKYIISYSITNNLLIVDWGLDF
jgi:16S rRNA processing protein RimM